MSSQSEADRLRQAIQALEGQRAALGEEVLAAALAPLREKLATLEGAARPEQRKQVTVLFADLVGFTALSTRLDPEEVGELMDAYFQRWSECIRRQEGVVEKYIGDAVVAVFGIPVSHEDDPERAIRSAIAMQTELSQLNQGFEHLYGQKLSMRVGITTGEVMVSLLGGRQGEDFVVVGEIVNLASRLQAAAPADEILITQDTYRHVSGLFETSSFGPLQLKGFDHPVQAYQVTGARLDSFRRTGRGVEGVQTALFGREAELGQLEHAFQHVLERKESCLVMISGEAGLGKTRLLYEFESQIEPGPEGDQIYRGRAHPATQNSPYALARDLFASHCQIQDSDPPPEVKEKLVAEANLVWDVQGAGEMKIHLIAHLLGFEIGDSEYIRRASSDVKSLHDRAIIYLGDYFRKKASTGLLIFLLEDLHWADDSSLSLISRLGRLLSRQPYLLVGTARPSFYERIPNWGREYAVQTRLPLQSLDQASSQAFAAEILKKVDPLPAALLKLIVDTAEGNPFYIEELIKMLIEDGVVQIDGEHGWVEERRLSELRVPPTLTGVLQARFDALDPAQRTCLQRAAVVGRVFWDRAIEALGKSFSPGHPHGSFPIPETLEQLSRREMVFQRRESSLKDTLEYQFKHALTREVTYATLLKRERRFYHGLAAHWLEQITQMNGRSSEFSLLIAEHYEWSGETAKAAEWYLDAGRAAAARFANNEAVHAFSQSLALSPGDDPRWHFSCLLEREKVYELLGKQEERLQDLNSLHKAALDLGDQTLLATVALRKASFAFQTGDYSGSLEQAQQAESLAEKMQKPELTARSLLLQAGCRMRQGELNLSGKLAGQALSLVKGINLPDLQAECFRHLGLVAYYLGNHGPSYEHFTRALALYEQAGNRPGEVLALNNLGGASFDASEYQRAEDYYSRSLQLAHEIGDRMGEGRALNNLGIVAVSQGNYALAEAYYLQSLDINREVGHRSSELSALDNLGNLAAYRYNYSLAENYQLEALKGGQEIGDRVTQCFALGNLSRVHLSLGAFERAREAAQESLELSREFGDQQGECHGLTILSLCHLRLRAPEQAFGLCESALSKSQELGLRSEQAAAFHLMGLILFDLGRLEEAAEQLNQALEIRRELEELIETAESQAALGIVHLGQGDIQGAVKCVDAVLAHLSIHGVEGFEQPVKIFLNSWQILSAAEDPRAEAVLRQGCSLMDGIAKKIEFEPFRQQFLERLPENRALAAACRTVSHP